MRRNPMKLFNFTKEEQECMLDMFDLFALTSIEYMDFIGSTRLVLLYDTNYGVQKFGQDAKKYAAEHMPRFMWISTSYEALNSIDVIMNMVNVVCSGGACWMYN